MIKTISKAPNLKKLTQCQDERSFVTNFKTQSLRTLSLSLSVCLSLCLLTLQGLTETKVVPLMALAAPATMVRLVQGIPVPGPMWREPVERDLFLVSYS